MSPAPGMAESRIRKKNSSFINSIKSHSEVGGGIQSRPYILNSVIDQGQGLEFDTRNTIFCVTVF